MKRYCRCPPLTILARWGICSCEKDTLRGTALVSQLLDSAEYGRWENNPLFFSFLLPYCEDKSRDIVDSMTNDLGNESRSQLSSLARKTVRCPDHDDQTRLSLPLSPLERRRPTSLQDQDKSSPVPFDCTRFNGIEF